MTTSSSPSRRGKELAYSRKVDIGQRGNLTEFTIKSKSVSSLTPHVEVWLHLFDDDIGGSVVVVVMMRMFFMSGLLNALFKLGAGRSDEESHKQAAS